MVFEDIEYPNPRLDITARTRIPRPQSPFEEAGTPHDVELGIHVGGTLEHPDIEPLPNDEGLTREDILPLLIANYYSEAGTAAQGGWSSRLSQVVASQVSQIGTRQFSRLGVETFELDPYYQSGQLDLAATRLTVGLYTVPNLYIYGRSTLTFEGVEEVGFEYRLSRLLQIEGRRDEEQLHHVNLRLHWEF
ncbi:MAG: hypothetical protein D6800_05605 [Candidatus Zixiibacteriota bacterium]|nr:MAG: hypothetical protein D6800_05605 [candidate division Zixibacteria bacterium]